MAPKRKRHRPTSKESSFTDCPACQMKVVSYLINHHLDWDCLALVRNKERLLIAEAAETTGAFSKSPEGISGNKEPESHAHCFQEFEARLHDKSTEARHHDYAIQEFEVRVEDRLPVNKAEEEFGDHDHIHNLDAEGKEGSIVVHPETNFQYWQIHSSDKKPPDESFQKSTALKLNAHSCNELDLKRHGGQPDASSKLESNTNHHYIKEIKEQISSCCEDVIRDKLDSEAQGNALYSVNASYSPGRIQPIREASALSPKNAKKDGWGFITASLPPKVPKGHYVHENFISEKEEQELLSFLDMDIRNPWKLITFNGSYLGKAYGLSTDLKRRRVCPAAFEMPKILVPVFERMRTTVPVLKDFWPNETNAIDYYKDKGHWLKPHVDDRQLSGTILVNLSLYGDCKMTYERERGPRESYKVLLRRRCIQIQSGECRYNFTHSILNEDLLAPRRVSMTFRQSLSL